MYIAIVFGWLLSCLLLVPELSKGKVGERQKGKRECINAVYHSIGNALGSALL